MISATPRSIDGLYYVMTHYHSVDYILTLPTILLKEPSPCRQRMNVTVFVPTMQVPLARHCCDAITSIVLPLADVGTAICNISRLDVDA